MPDSFSFFIHRTCVSGGWYLACRLLRVVWDLGELRWLYIHARQYGLEKRRMGVCLVKALSLSDKNGLDNKNIKHQRQLRARNEWLPIHCYSRHRLRASTPNTTFNNDTRPTQLTVCVYIPAKKKQRNVSSNRTKTFRVWSHDHSKDEPPRTHYALQNSTSKKLHRLPNPRQRRRTHSFSRNKVHYTIPPTIATHT